MCTDNLNPAAVSHIYSKEKINEVSILSFMGQNHKPKDENNIQKIHKKCPICETLNPIYDTGEIRCGTCQCILAANIEYVANKKIDLPWGIRL